MDIHILDFLKQCNLKLENAHELDGLFIPRQMFLSVGVYEKVKPQIIELKKKFSSSSLTALQKDAEKDQKWPLLNLVRQILRACDYQMKPVRKSAGYTLGGKKKYERFFFISKLKSVKHMSAVQTGVECEQEEQVVKSEVTNIK